MRRVAIQDANILIDLVDIDLFSTCLTLKFSFSTTQLIFESELNDRQISAINVYVDSGNFTIIETTASELLEIQDLSLEDPRLSVQDWSAIYYAQKANTLLLSGDRVLRNVSAIRGIEVRGVLWIFDQLVSEKVISKKEACFFIQELMKVNKRLPQEECQKRMTEWCGNSD